MATNQYEYIGPDGMRHFASTPQELSENNPDGLQRGGRQLNIESQAGLQQAMKGGADERQMAYLQQLQMELARSKMEREQADMAYNPTMSELGVGGGPGGSGQSLNGGGTLANINQQGGTTSGPFGGEGASYTNISPADKAYNPVEQPSGLPPDMRLQDLRRIAENTKHLPNNIQEQILAKMLGVQPDSVTKHLERMMVLQQNRADKKEAAATVVDNRKRTFQTTNAASMFNKRTGESLAMSDTTDLDPEQIEKDYMFLRPDQRKDKENLDKLRGTIDEYKEIIGELGFSDNAAGALANAAKIKLGRQMGDAKVARLDALNAQITTLARAFGGDSRVAVQELEMLKNAVVSDRETKGSALTRIGQLERMYEQNAKSFGLPWMQKPVDEEEGQLPKLNQRNQAAINAMSKAEQAGTLPPQQAAILQELRRRGVIE